MKKIYRTTLLTVALGLALAGCNTDYNFDKLSFEVTVGGSEGIIVPLGSTGEIKVSELLSDTVLETDKDGYYSFSTSDSFSYTVDIGSVDPIRDIVPAVEPQTFEVIGNMSVEAMKFSNTSEIPLPAGLTTGLVIPEGSPLIGLSAPLEFGPNIFEHDIEISVPSQVTSLGVITFGEDGKGSPIDVYLNLNNLEGVTTGRIIEKFDIELPAGFTLALRDGDTDGTLVKGEGSTTPNHYSITNCEVSGSVFHLGFLIKSFDMSNTTLSEGKANVSTSIKYSFLLRSQIKAGTVTTKMPSVNAEANLLFHNATIKTNNLEIAVDVPTQTISQSVDVPAELTHIEYLSIADANNPTAVPMLNIDLGLEGSPISEVALKHINIKLPPFIDIDAPTNWTLEKSSTEQRLKCEQIIIPNGATTNMLTLPIKGINNITIKNSKIALTGGIGMSAIAAIPGDKEITIDTSAKNITITPSVTLSDIAVKEISGYVDPDLSELIEPQELDLSDFSSVLSDASLDLNLCSPVLNLSVENPIGVEIDATATIVATKADAEVARAVANIEIKGAQDDTPMITHLTITADESDEEGVVCVPELFDIINSLPDKITVELNAETNKDKLHKLVLKDSYTFKVDYSVYAGIKFNPNKEGKISYSTVIEDVDLSELNEMEDVDLLVDSLTLNVIAKSTLPIDALLKVEFLDENKEPISQVKSTTTGLIKGSTSGEESESTISIGIGISSTEGVAPISHVAKTRALRCTFEGATLAGGGLKPDQYLSAQMWLNLDNGITVDFGTLEEIYEEAEEAIQ